MRLVLFPSVHVLMHAERILRQAGLPFEVLPTPLRLSRECGMCLGLDDGLEAPASAALGDLDHRIADPPEATP